MTSPKVRCSISPMARMVLSRMKQKSRVHSVFADVPEFASAALESSHPYIDSSIIDRICALDRGFQIYWELQGRGEFRWHVMKHLAESKEDVPWSIYLVEEANGSYLPLDTRALRKMEKVCWLNRDIRRYVKDFQAEEDRIAEIKDNDQRREGEALAGELRSIVRRLAWSHNGQSTDPGWGVGYTASADGTLEVGQSSKSRTVTKAI
jgi:hypothetical protein